MTRFITQAEREIIKKAKEQERREKQADAFRYDMIHKTLKRRRNG